MKDMIGAKDKVVPDGSNVDLALGIPFNVDFVLFELLVVSGEKMRENRRQLMSESRSALLKTQGRKKSCENIHYDKRNTATKRHMQNTTNKARMRAKSADTKSGKWRAYCQHVLSSQEKQSPMKSDG